MKRRKKQASSAVIAVALAVGLSGCGGVKTEESSFAEEETRQEQPQEADEQSQEADGQPEEPEEAEPSEAAGVSEPEEASAGGEEEPEKEMEKEIEEREMSEEEKIMEQYGIEIFCPEEFSKKSGEVSYGELVNTSYYSTTCEKDRKVNILLPAGYTEEKQYPVLYLLHGIFGTENDMVFNGTTIGNMIAKGAAREMIVVFPYMYASKTKDACTAIDKENIDAYNNFINDLTNDLMPFMEENYSVAVGKENTAIAGFSMGGRESLAIGLQRPDLFDYVGAISPAPGLVPGKDWAMEHEGQFAEEQLVFADEKPYFLMVCCGDSDKVVGTFPKSYHEIFVKNQVEHVWWEIPGSDHGDPAITSGVYNFCKNIFTE